MWMGVLSLLNPSFNLRGRPMIGIAAEFSWAIDAETSAAEGALDDNEVRL